MKANNHAAIVDNSQKEYAIEIEQLISTLQAKGLHIDFSDVSRASKERRNSNCQD